MTSSSKRKLGFVAAFAVYFSAVWFLWNTPAIYPIKIFVVMLHEISHGLVSLATGGTIERIVLDPYQGGACFCGGGNAFLTLSAGYLGSLLWGVGLLSAAQAPRISNRFLVTLVGGTVVVLSLLYVRNGFGLLFGLGFGATLFAAGQRLSAGANRVILTTLGLTSCLYALLDIKSDVLDRPHLASDAAMLGDLTRTPTMLWGVLWIALAIVTLVLYFRYAYRKA